MPFLVWRLKNPPPEGGRPEGPYVEARHGRKAFEDVVKEKRMVSLGASLREGRMREMSPGLKSA
jgi:hypothetical protein